PLQRGLDLFRGTDVENERNVGIELYGKHCVIIIPAAFYDALIFDSNSASVSRWRFHKGNSIILFIREASPLTDNQVNLMRCNPPPQPGGFNEGDADVIYFEFVISKSEMKAGRVELQTLC